MSQMHANNHAAPGDDESQEELERRLLAGMGNEEKPLSDMDTGSPISSGSYTALYDKKTGEEEEEQERSTGGSDLQGALGLFAEATQDMATAGVELALGRHFACADYCNQAVEKAAQAVALLRYGRRVMYDHDLRALGAQVGAPAHIQDEMATLTPFHPEAFYADTPPEDADGVISAEQAEDLKQHARQVLRWARAIILNA